ncbi:hypothetical protein BJ165DRAFT_137244 [Panaeolus papilionaceus]|nr:hypothetical protein BJ165DRAFT_137244 [Panaeolus papilionaceus]
MLSGSMVVALLEDEEDGACVVEAGADEGAATFAGGAGDGDLDELLAVRVGVDEREVGFAAEDEDGVGDIVFAAGEGDDEREAVFTAGAGEGSRDADFIIGVGSATLGFATGTLSTTSGSSAGGSTYNGEVMMLGISGSCPAVEGSFSTRANSATIDWSLTPGPRIMSCIIASASRAGLSAIGLGACTANEVMAGVFNESGVEPEVEEVDVEDETGPAGVVVVVIVVAVVDVEVEVANGTADVAAGGLTGEISSKSGEAERGMSTEAPFVLSMDASPEPDFDEEEMESFLDALRTAEPTRDVHFGFDLPGSGAWEVVLEREGMPA